MLIATIRSVALDRIQGPVIVDEGFFELEVDVDMELARASGDPKGYINKEISAHIGQCVRATKIPIHEKLWAIEFSIYAQTVLEYPEGFVI